ncbi:MAG TPA: helix-turn-helix domain-containing protein [Polyangiaceae bacterium]|jgi:AcrR family transcriptional regulator|nr:helix-turn-helix domain-containing protein [Polyangiaceae bacterium]
MNPREGSRPRRRYHMTARALAAAATRQRILNAARELLLAAPGFDDVSLEQIAERAGVALKTVQRRFGSKRALLIECGPTERGERKVTPGDIAGIAHALASRHEATMDVVVRYLAVEARVPELARRFSDTRAGHWRWLEEVFAPHLPARRSRLQRQRVAELFAATELYTWHSWRRRFGISRDQAERALTEMLEALVARWQTSGDSAGRAASQTRSAEAAPG